MGFDPAKANAYLQQARQIEQTLSEHQELFDEGKFLDFQSVTTALETEIQRAQQDARKLSIGIVGAMKAGKSSFLNACIFGGKDVLPKAATPMTAALTRIRYSETPQATVHFYERKDWEKIEDNAQKYEEQLNTKYSNYCKIYDRSHADSTEGVCSKQVFERTLFQQDVSEVLKSAKELTQMVGSNSAILEHLGDADVLDGDIMAKLQDYVGVREYYRVGPLLVQAIDRTPDPDALYQSLWEDYIRPSCTALENRQWEPAKQIYVRMVKTLCLRFGVEVRPQICEALKDY